MREVTAVMTNPGWISIPIACFALFAVTLPVQESQLQAQTGNADITGLPAGRGIYYHAAPGWVALQSTVLMPFSEDVRVLDILSLGPTHAVAEIPGPHAALQIGSTRPTFYARGISVAELYLVRGAPKADYRELRMPIGRNFEEWAHFRAKDVTGIVTQRVAVDVVTVKPRTDLKPGEYALASVFDPGDRWIRLGYEFGLTAGRTEP